MTQIGIKTAQEAQGRQGKPEDVSQAIPGWELCESSPAVTRLTVYRRPHVMRTVGQQATFGAKLFMASEVLFRNVLRIYLSEFGEGQE